MHADNWGDSKEEKKLADIKITELSLKLPKEEVDAKTVARARLYCHTKKEPITCPVEYCQENANHKRLGEFLSACVLFRMSCKAKCNGEGTSGEKCDEQLRTVAKALDALLESAEQDSQDLPKLAEQLSQDATRMSHEAIQKLAQSFQEPVEDILVKRDLPSLVVDDTLKKTLHALAWFAGCVLVCGTIGWWAAPACAGISGTTTTGAILADLTTFGTGYLLPVEMSAMYAFGVSCTAGAVVGGGAAVRTLSSKVEEEAYRGKLRMLLHVLDPDKASDPSTGQLEYAVRALWRKCGQKLRHSGMNNPHTYQVGGEARPLSEKGAKILTKLLDFFETAWALRDLVEEMPIVFCFGRKNVGKTSLQNNCFGWNMPCGTHAEGSTREPAWNFDQQDKIWVVDWPGSTDKYAAQFRRLPSVGGLGSAVLVMEAAHRDKGDEDLMQQIEEAGFDRILVLCTKADHKDKDQNYEISTHQHLKGEVQHYFKDLGCKLPEENIVITALVNVTLDDLNHHDYDKQEVAFEKLKKFVKMAPMRRSANQQ